MLTDETNKNLTVLGEFGDIFLRNLVIGVDIFFLVSGFLITYILIEEKKRFGEINIKNFMIRRTLRIWSLYLNTLSRMDILVIRLVTAYNYSKKAFNFRLNRWVRYDLIFLLILALSIEPVELWANYFQAGFKIFFTIGIFSVLLLDYNFASNFKHILLILSLSITIPIISYEPIEKHILKINKKFRWIKTDR